MRRRDFFYPLPEDRIAQRPAAQRSGSRLLCLHRGDGALRDQHIRDLPALLRAGDLLVLNDTRVIPARLFGRKATGGAVEVLVERVLDSHRMSAKLRASKTPPTGSSILFDGARARVAGRDGELFLLELEAGEIDALLAHQGHIPLPPYIRRPDEQTDRERYQTLWARRPGAVAAPTAGLHFDQALLDAIAAAGVHIGYLTLHVGSGTYQRVRQQDLRQHRLHCERIEVGAELCTAIAATRAAGARVVAVGTTVVRSLETAAAATGKPEPFAGETSLFITPGFAFRAVDALITNFHEPESTLLMLVCAFGGYRPVLTAYDHALAAGYRFLSYGDAMWIA